MNNVLIIVIVCLSVSLVLTWLCIGIKYFILMSDFKSKKDYLREISEELNNLNHTFKNVDKSIYMWSNKDEQ